MSEVLAICLATIGVMCLFIGLGHGVVMLMDWSTFRRVMNNRQPWFPIFMILFSGILFYLASLLVGP